MRALICALALTVAILSPTLFARHFAHDFTILGSTNPSVSERDFALRACERLAIEPDKCQIPPRLHRIRPPSYFAPIPSATPPTELPTNRLSAPKSGSTSLKLRREQKGDAVSRKSRVKRTEVKPKMDIEGKTREILARMQNQGDTITGLPQCLTSEMMGEKTKKLADSLPPHPIFTLFSRIISIPRPSMREGRLRDFARSLAHQHGWWYRIDEHGNMLIRRPGRSHSHAASVCLQAHQDMVTIAAQGHEIDFEKNGIDAHVSNGFIRANGTTLGADNGIGIAAAFALLLDNSIEGPLEVLLTSNEEAGMSGARNLRRKWFRSRMLINLDSEESNRVTAGCAGSFAKRLTIRPERENVESLKGKQLHYFGVQISNLTGGHSGLMIHRNISSAISVMAEGIRQVMAQKIPIHLIAFKGGDAQNSIPSKADAWLAVEREEDIEAAEEIFERTFQSLQLSELKAFGQEEGVESVGNKGLPHFLKFKYLRTMVDVYSSNNQRSGSKPWVLEFLRDTEGTQMPPPLTRSATKRLVKVLLGAPHGCFELSPLGHVESSVALSTASLAGKPNGKLELYFKARLSGKSEPSKLDDHLSRFGKRHRLKVLPMENFSRGWTALASSLAADYVRFGHKRVFGYEPGFQEVHGGLELGLIAQKYPNLDCVSMGPEILDAHTTEERLKIDTVIPWYEWLKSSVRAFHEDSDRIQRILEDTTIRLRCPIFKASSKRRAKKTQYAY